FSAGTRVTGDTSGVAPGFEFNYGLIPNGQLHIVVPLAFDSPWDGPTQFGYGDTEVGFKYRFIEEDKDGARPQVGIFPFVELPTGDQTRSLGAGHARVYLPVWLQKSFGNWTTYGGGGYWINNGANSNDKDYWFFGWLLQRQVTETLAIGGELFYQTATASDRPDSAGFNVGAIYDFDKQHHLLVSAGRGLHNAAETNLFSWYVAFQITR
ncbi:MAG: transporter, partial [Reyranellales bacterium]